MKLTWNTLVYFLSDRIDHNKHLNVAMEEIGVSCIYSHFQSSLNIDMLTNMLFVQKMLKYFTTPVGWIDTIITQPFYDEKISHTSVLGIYEINLEKAASFFTKEVIGSIPFIEERKNIKDIKGMPFIYRFDVHKMTELGFTYIIELKDYKFNKKEHLPYDSRIFYYFVSTKILYQFLTMSNLSLCLRNDLGKCTGNDFEKIKKHIAEKCVAENDDLLMQRVCIEEMRKIHEQAKIY